MNVRVIDFKTEYRVGKDPVDKVLVAPSGPAFEKTQTWHRIEKIRPPVDADENFKASQSYQAMLARWEVVEPAYNAWKNGQEIPETGTPLDAWSGVTADQARALKAMGIKTVEAVRDMGDAAMSELRMPNARQLPKMAASWLETSDAAAKEAENAELRERIAAMEEMLAERQEQPKRGRPPKKETEAA